MSIERSYINTRMFGYGKDTPLQGDPLAINRGYYYNSQNDDGPQGGEFAKKKVSVTFGTPTQEFEDLGGCFEFNDIYKIYPITIRSSALKYNDFYEQFQTQEGKPLVVWRKMLFGTLDTGQQADNPLVEVSTPYGMQLMPFGADGLLPKSLFNARYFDYSFKQTLPSRPEIAVINQNELGQTSPSQDLSAMYSFFNSDYENYAADNKENYNETSLPYIYNFIDEIHNSDSNNLFSSLDQTKTFYWNDPKCNIFLGGSNTPSTLYNADPILYATNQPFSVNQQIVDYAPSISEPFNDIAQFEKRMHGAFLGSGLGDGLDTLYEGQYIKQKDSALKQYFIKWTKEALSPSEPVVKEEIQPAFQLYTVERTKNVRKVLEHKYKNIFFRQSELMDYNHTQTLFPMSTKIDIENLPSINSNQGWQKAEFISTNFKKAMEIYLFYENIFEKLVETTAQPFVKGYVEGELQQGFYVEEYLYPRTLDDKDEFYESRTNFTTIDYDKTTGKETLGLPFNAKILDFKEFIKEIKDPEGDFTFDNDSYNAEASHNRTENYASIGINKELGSEDFYFEDPIFDPAAALDEIDPNYSPTNPLLADYFSQYIYDLVHHVFDTTVTSKFSWSGGLPSVLPDDPHAQFKAYNEVIGVRVSKHEIDELTGVPMEKPIQNMYFPNSSKPDNNAQNYQEKYPSWNINYIDTHVKYGKRYFYKTHLITAIVGKRYFYRNLTAPKIVEEGNKSYFQSTMQMVVEPSVVIAEVPYSEVGMTSVTSPPPLPPIAEFIPSSENPGYVKILLLNDNNSGHRKPIPVEETDKEYYSKVLQSQNPKGEDAGKIYFTSDDDVAGYRIYRLDEKPVTLSDFSDAYTLLSTDLDATHYDDLMNLNQKYYYMFRTIDVHNGPSNPSNIYEIELVSLSDGTADVAIYPVIKVYSIGEFFKGEAYPNKKMFRRYIHIKPSRNQSELSSLEKLLSDDAYKLNLQDPDTGELLEKFSDEWNKYSEDYSIKKNEFPTFGSYAPESRYIIGSKIGDDVSTLKNRKIKIRLTSKSTGRKIDLNLNFKHTHFPHDPKHADKNENVPDQDDK
jgi:hypothetical protein